MDTAKTTDTSTPVDSVDALLGSSIGTIPSIVMNQDDHDAMNTTTNPIEAAAATSDISIVSDQNPLQTIAPRLIVIAPTFYTDSSDIRYSLALDCCREAANHKVELLIVDNSPSDAFRKNLEKAGNGFVIVTKQASKGRKGAALREGIRWAAMTLMRDPNTVSGGSHNMASSDINPASRRALIGFQEPEKVDMIRHWKSVAEHAVATNADIVCPRRNDASFQATYPIEQYYAEKFANLSLDVLGKAIGMPSIDWTIGPVALDVSMAERWLACNGEIWDAQLLPIIDCFLNNAIVADFEIDYRHPKTMKEEEEGNFEFNDKRLLQLNFLQATVGKRLKEEGKKQLMYEAQREKIEADFTTCKEKFRNKLRLENEQDNEHEHVGSKENTEAI